MPSLAETYVPFVPARLVGHHQRHPGPPQRPQSEPCRGAVVFADIIGYTALTESYSRRGAQGVEELESVLRVFFGRLEALITQYGGDIISFAGDSVLALWSAGSSDDLPPAARLAVQCAHAAQRALDGTELGGGVRLRLCVGVAAGDMLVATVGGLDGEWKYVLAGAPLAAAGIALKRADPGNVVLAAEAWRLVGRHCAGEELGDGYARLGHVSDVLEPPPVPRPCACREGTEALRSYIPKPVLEHLDAGQADWLAEFRRATTVFVAVREIDYRLPDALARLQSAVAVMQSTVHRYEGSFARLAVDDKGTNALCVWGIPGRGHEDDPEWAVCAGLAIIDGLRGIDIACGIGVATGHVLFGLSGGGSRYEYTVTGDAINLAARLMAAAEGGMLCDRATCEAARDAIAFEQLSPIPVKGRGAPVPVGRPRPVQAGREARASQRSPRAPAIAARFVGREVERGRLLERLEALRAGTGAFITLEGEPGIGKSRLIAELTRAAHEAGVHCLLGYADAIERGTVYFAWRAILTQIFEHEAATGPAARREYLEALFAREPVLRSWLPVLNDMLPVGFAESVVTLQMSEHARAECTSELLLRVLRAAASRAPTLVVLEDVHWMDSMSWNLAARMQRGVAPVLLVLLMRSGHAPESDDATQLLSIAANERIRLDPLSRADTEALVCDRLRVQAVAPEVVSLVHEKTDGHPLVTEELSRALRDSGYLRIERGQCELAPGVGRTEALVIPESIEGIIASRIDRLSASEKLTLKVASVVGRGFPAHIVRAIHPVESGSANLSDQFETFAALDLIRPEGRGAERRYSFKHAITQEVTYKLLAYAQRRQLHRAAARWYEEANSTEPAAVYPLLAHHWSRADDPPKAFEYLHKAGEQAFNRYANREAVDFLENALALQDRLDDAETREQRTRCVRLLGYARLWLGELPESQTRIQQSLALIGSPVPTSRRGLLLGTMGQMAVSVCSGLFGTGTPRGDRRRTDLEGAVATDLLRLGHIAYFNNDIALSLYTSLRCLNYAGRTEPCRETALIYAAMASGAGMVPLHRLARRYIDLALGAARVVNEPEIASQVLLFVSMYGAGVGDWQACVAKVRQAAELARITGNSRRIEECMVVLGYLHFHSGDLEAARKDFETIVVAGRGRGDRQTTGWGLLGVSRVLLAQARPREALEVLEQAAPLAADRLSRIELHGQVALAYLRREAFAESLAAARAGLNLVAAARPSSFSTLTGTAAIAESLLGLWVHACQGRPGTELSVLARQSRSAVLALRRFASIFPIGKPQALLQSGVYSHLLGRRRRAAREWHRALSAAAALGMPREEEMIALTQARHA